MVVSSWSGWLRTALFGTLHSVVPYRPRYPKNIDFPSNHTPCFTLRPVSLPDYWQWTHRTFKCHFFWQNSFCSQQSLPFASSHVSELSKKWKSRRKSQNQRKFQRSRRSTASSGQSAANQHRVFDVIYNALWVKKKIYILFSNGFSRSKKKSKRLAI